MTCPLHLEQVDRTKIEWPRESHFHYSCVSVSSSSEVSVAAIDLMRYILSRNESLGESTSQSKRKSQ